MTGKVTVDLAFYWHITDSVVYPPTGSMAWEWEMSTPTYAPLEYYSMAWEWEMSTPTYAPLEYYTIFTIGCWYSIHQMPLQTLDCFTFLNNLYISVVFRYVHSIHKMLMSKASFGDD